VRRKASVDLVIDERIAAELRKQGIVPLRYSVDGNTAMFANGVTCHRPKPDPDVDRGDAVCATRVSYVHAICRIGQYVRCILRDSDHLFQSARQCQNYLNSWIRQYTASGAASGRSAMAPFVDA
jgi:predicted component of type VI protein secretion system